ncbi:hypothetical protein SAMD00019534_081360, partial [Acytostelium subglobosum LB1]|uniref:hypothetical protein n=1 Tax=Acytostelium subglobosum LB1 TaxID=1410327 RepID=UPI000644818B
MCRTSFIIILLAALFGLCHSQSYTPTWSSINSRPLPEWYDQSKFGIFIQWGVYSVPAYATPMVPTAEWYWHTLENPDLDDGATQAYHNKSYGPDFSYQSFAPMFKANLFDVQLWSEVIRASGARYVVLTSKHHEGYTNWPSAESWGWNSADVGPMMDIVGTISKEFKQSGLYMGLYYSLFEWYNPLYLANKDSGVPPTSNSYITEVMMPQLLDIVNTYQPDIIWSDGDWEQNSTYWESTDFLAWLYTNSSVKDTVVTNDRWGADCRGKNGGFWTPTDRYDPLRLVGHKWENCYTIGTSWGYNQYEPLAAYQTTTQLLEAMVTTVSCGGNFLLDVGPTSDGIIPLIMQDRLLDIGDWMGINGEAIYNSTPWRVQNDTADIWYTYNADSDVIYAFSFTWPVGGQLQLHSPIGNPYSTIEILGVNAVIQWWGPNHSIPGMKIFLPPLAPSEYPPHGVYVFALYNVQ